MNQSSHATVLDLRSRCIQALNLRQQGKEEEAQAIEPSLEEIRKGLIALRADRASATASKTASSEAKKSIPMDLNELFSSSSTSTPTVKK